ncbi:UNVERIFIED_CONTAM: hypothetical protein H355_005897 [Colinus virginianus]|nr:hypothetical protein H355_005897 [Colinus virginianus]
MSTLGIRIPDRLVSYGQTMQMTRRDHWAWPQTVSAGLALCCHTSVCLSFMEKGEIWLRRNRWDNLGSYAGDAGSSSLGLPFLAEDQHMRKMV